MKILVLNAGSSSQKSCLYEITGEKLPENPPKPIWEAAIDWTANDDYGLMEIAANGIEKKIKLNPEKRLESIAKMLETLRQGETKVIDKLSDIDVVGHRVVHGGSDYSEATFITDKVKATIKNLIPLAPTHNPNHLEGIEAIEKTLGNVAQIAVFDTAFHSKMPKKAAVYPIPYEWFEKGIRRYGFHGTSHKYCVQKTAKILGKPLESLRIITCHLGNGASLAAVRNGISINTTMGFTPLEGLMMGTRSGSIDPAILIYLMREHGLDAEKLNTILNKESGLKGISGKSGDMRYITTAMQEGDERAQLAFDIYIHQLHCCIGKMLASLGGMDVLVFTAGIGERSVIVREKTCENFEFLGLKIDKEKNIKPGIDTDISTSDSTVRILVVHTEEDWAIACECWQKMNQA
ncbi:MULTISPECIES: acetate kinase [Okeania]|uniref:acetate kinase n=1 Tax=Okeania TaxID=1458928 RepID=UPI000F5243FD|nr:MULTISPECIES: acetate kinase [Okeania]NEP38088.1 acetate kinase [Okeania sp. SIO2H7]NEP74122.1 acetate kinase [Okeania sp. SIO2G5]NEP95042.1 acetate kinase [Okeania sp. SIO2F5]NEQ92838.1 acetate kinase [Okeania sp. SIO2G4]RQH25070.1 acetate kinase [Okeania hirsuta]